MTSFQVFETFGGTHAAYASTPVASLPAAPGGVSQFPPSGMYTFPIGWTCLDPPSGSPCDPAQYAARDGTLYVTITGKDAGGATSSFTSPTLVLSAAP